jgi:hypothetical protein
MIKVFLFIFWAFTQSSHVAMMSAECFPDEGLIKVYLKTSHDDFKYDYRFKIDDDQIFDESGKIDTTKIFVSKYLASRIQMFANNNLLSGRITSFESDNNEVNMRLIYHYNKKAKQFKVSNTFMNGVNRNPTTLLIFKYKDIEQEAKLTEDKTEQTFVVK